jgi:hypothetical protein
MKLKVLPFLFAACVAHCCEKSPLTIRLGQTTDIPQLNQLSHKEYQNYFKPMWKTHYQPVFPNLDMETFVAEKTDLNNKNNTLVIKTQNEDYSNPDRLLVAELEDQKTHTKQIAGFLRFKLQDKETVYMSFILVDEKFRNQGIAKQLAAKATTTFAGITNYRFRTPIRDEQTNKIYLSHGCKQIGAISIDLKTGQSSTDPNAPITHYDYLYQTKR